MAVTDLFSVLSPKLNADVKAQVDASQYQDASQRSYNYAYSPTRQFTDARQLVLVLNSPNASTTTKKEERIALDAATEQRSAQENAARQDGAQIPLSLNLPSLFGGGSGVGTALIIGAVIVGGVLLIRGGKK